MNILVGNKSNFAAIIDSALFMLRSMQGDEGLRLRMKEMGKRDGKRWPSQLFLSVNDFTSVGIIIIIILLVQVEKNQLTLPYLEKAKLTYNDVKN